MLLLVLLAHGLLLMLLTVALQRGSRFAAAPAVAPAMNLVWLRPPEASPSPPATANQALPPKLPLRPMPMRPEAPRLAPDRPAVEPQAISISPMPRDEPTPLAAPASPPPLDLRLPAQRASQPLPAAALTREDPRVRERLSYGERMARGIGTDNSLHEEALPDGSRRFRQGTGCVVARPSRISELDGFNNSASPRPRSIGPC
jgi:hypothetical protein